MAHIDGIIVNLKTSWAHNAGDPGTDDHIYVGVFGKGGGSEFPLDVRGFNDFEEGSDVKYIFGNVWEAGAATGARKPFDSDGFDHTISAGALQLVHVNDPHSRQIDLEMVDYVYLRKDSREVDDAWALGDVDVSLYATNSPLKRSFTLHGFRGLGRRYGQQLWLTEV